MTSPFSTFQEFSEAKGPIYTFANNPTMIAVLLLICLAITIYFFYAAFTIKQEAAKPDSTALSVLILAGCVSLFSFLLPAPQKATEAYRRESHRSPVALIGATLTGTFWQRQRSQRRSRHQSRHQSRSHHPRR